MKKTILFITILFAQHFSWGQAFGPDVIIKPDTVNQGQVEIAAAFNGWLFSAVSRRDETNNIGGITISKSTDGGYTWTIIDEYFVGGVRYPTFDITVTGNDEASLKVFLIGVNENTIATNYGIFVDTYNGQTGTFLGSVFNQQKGTDPVYDVEIASDYKFPGVGTSPFSVALLYSCYSNTRDSVACVLSVDGGVTFPIRSTVATTLNFMRNISLDYGRSNSASNGRYFAAWEQLATSSSRTGHIYTSRNLTTVDDIWVTPVNLDSLSSTMINLCRNPRIAVQQNDFDNDSASVTSVVTVDRDYNGDGSDYDMLGFYNKHSHSSNHWYRFDINNASTNDMSADVIYEEHAQLFHVAYLDSTDHQLKYVTNTINFLTPNAWTSVQSGMNDIPADTRIPNTRIVFRPTVNEIGLAWIDNASGGNGLAKFDLESFVSASVNESDLQLIIQLYPNPATDWLNVETTDQNTVISIVSMDGTTILTEEKSGTEFAVSVEHLASGMYILRVEQNGEIQQQQFVKQ